MKKEVWIYTVVAYVWSFAIWGVTILLAMDNSEVLQQNVQLVDMVLKGQLPKSMVFANVLSLLAVYGPWVGAIVADRVDQESQLLNTVRFRFDWKLLLYAVLLLTVITAIPSVPLILINGIPVMQGSYLVMFIPLFFTYQVLTSGMEEVGWRGYLLPKMLRTMTPWNASVRVGVLWALWHTPIVLYMFFTQGMALPQVISSFVGFTAGIIAMSVVHTYFFIKSKSVVLSVLIHALGNTIPMIFGLLTGESYVVAVAVQVLMWVFVVLLTRREKTLFDTVQAL